MLWTIAFLVQSLLVVGQQPLRTAQSGTFNVVGNSGVSAQQMFLGTTNKVYILDKTESNPISIDDHPAWAVEYDINDDTYRVMSVISNTFCAGGTVLGDGTWMVVGGNVAVGLDGIWSSVQDVPGDPDYHDIDGGRAMRFISPCDDNSCDWVDDPSRYMATRRWYATVETLEDGSAISIGGNQYGSFVNDDSQADNPTYEFYPPRGNGSTVFMQFLNDTKPANLYPLVWLLPSGQLFLQANWQATLFDHNTGKERRLPNIPGAVRSYPASAASVMLPLTPGNNFTAEILFCGGTDLENNQWNITWNLIDYPASASCVSIRPDVSPQWEAQDPLPIPRTMGNFILLPDQRIFLSGGGATGVAGFGGESWSMGRDLGASYAANPVFLPVIYDPYAAPGSKFSSSGLSSTTIPRMYHSSATLLPDGSVMIAGSNPNQDYTQLLDWNPFPTEYRVERFYPSYYSSTRPKPQGIPSSLSYGGPFFNLTLSKDDAGPIAQLEEISVVVIRTGYSTHAVNFGQRLLQLNSAYTWNEDDGSVVLHVSQMPPNPAIFQPGPAYLFVVVAGVPSIGVQVMVGSGKIGNQTINAVVELPASYPSTSALQEMAAPNSATGLGQFGQVYAFIAFTVAIALLGI